MTVLPAAATVTANNQTMVAGGGSASADVYVPRRPVSTFSTTPKCTTTATSSSPAGTYPISCAGAVAANYNLSYVGGTVTVSVAPTVPNGTPAVASLSPMTSTAGSANLALTVTGAGFVSGATVLFGMDRRGQQLW